MENLNPDLKKVKELALKLKEMAERGTTNEKVVAENKLTSLLKKYGLTIKDVLDNKIKERKFSFKHEDEATVLAHVIWSVAPKINILRYGKRKVAFCELTTEQYIEAKEKTTFYLDHFAKEKKNFILAYIFKNNLEVSSDSESEEKEDSKGDIDAKSVVDLMKGINQGNFVSKKKKKMISSSNQK